ncbi:MAG: GNAT family N-acetyltransferase [Sphaerochaetaceae bacterium]|nr:GNAT family N-acetyltransferase [Sphaerochaetaceae bacterium]
MSLVRNARLEDASRLQEIYAYYVLNSAITFEYIPPTEEEFRSRMEHTMKRFPYLVLEKEGKIMGYAYAEVFKARSAYDWSVETTIYLDKDMQKRGYGKKLYEALFSRLKAMGIQNLYACIGVPEEDDEFLDHNSVSFHEHMGFTLAGSFSQCGYKFDRYYNMVWMEKIINEHTIPANRIDTSKRR